MPEKYFVQISHHGRTVWVNNDLIGRHKDHCLCYDCANFHPGMPEQNCPIANLVYAVCIAQGVTLPVWECGPFREKQEATKP